MLFKAWLLLNEVALLLCIVSSFESHNTSEAIFSGPAGGNIGEGTHQYLVHLGGGSGTCAGTLISEHAVLTAAHCLKHSVQWVYFYPYNLNDMLQENYVSLKNTISHEGYDGDVKNDIAILILQDHNMNIDPVELNADLDVSGKTLALGWEDKRAATVSMRYVSNDDCTGGSDLFQYTEAQILPTMMCAEHGNKKGPCKGDSGE